MVPSAQGRPVLPGLAVPLCREIQERGSPSDGGTQPALPSAAAHLRVSGGQPRDGMVGAPPGGRAEQETPPGPAKLHPLALQLLLPRPRGRLEGGRRGCPGVWPCPSHGGGRISRKIFLTTGSSTGQRGHVGGTDAHLPSIFISQLRVWAASGSPYLPHSRKTDQAVSSMARVPSKPEIYSGYGGLLTLPPASPRVRHRGSNVPSLRGPPSPPRLLGFSLSFLCFLAEGYGWI